MPRNISEVSPMDTVTDLVEKIGSLSVEKMDETIDRVAHVHGDDFAGSVLENLSALKIAAILTETDFSTPSVISAVLSPRRSIRVIKRLPLFWMDVEDKERSDHLIRFRAQTLDQLLNFLLNNKVFQRQEEILEEISRDDLAMGYLLLSFHDWQIGPEQVSFFEHHDVEFGTHEQLFEIIRWAAPYLAEVVLKEISSGSVSLRDKVGDIHSEALDQFLPDRKYQDIEKQMFTPVGM